MHGIEVDGRAYEVLVVESLGGCPAVIIDDLVIVADTGSEEDNRRVATIAVQRVNTFLY